MTTAVLGDAASSWRHTSGPSMSSSLTSSSITSGRFSPAIRIASWPVRASPITVMSRSTPSEKRSPCLTTSWSSATTMRILSIVPSQTGYRALHAETRRNIAMKRHAAPDGGDALGDQPQPEMTRVLAGAWVGRGRHPDPVVHDLEQDRLARHVDSHRDAGGARVLDDVGERLLQHVDQGVAVRLPEPAQVSPLREFQRQAAELLEVLDELAEALGVVSGAVLGGDLVDERPELQHDERGVALDLLELRAQAPGSRRVVQTPVQLEPDREQGLAERVVQPGRHPYPLSTDRQLLGLLVQPGVDDGQRRLVRDPLDQADLLRGEPRPAGLPHAAQHADALPLGVQARQEDRPHPEPPEELMAEVGIVGHIVGPDAPALFIQVALELAELDDREPLALDRLEEALRDVVARERLKQQLVLGLEEDPRRVGADGARRLARDAPRHLPELEGGADRAPHLEQRLRHLEPALPLLDEVRVVDRQRQLAGDRPREARLSLGDRRRVQAVVQVERADHAILPEQRKDEDGAESERVDPVARHEPVGERILHEDGLSLLEGLREGPHLLEPVGAER